MKNMSIYKPSSDDFEFRQFPFYWVMRVGNAYSLRMEKSLKKINVNSTSWRILMILREEGKLSVSDIATHAVVKMPTITKAVYKLQKDGLVDVTTCKNDRRVSIAILTDEGNMALSQVIDSTKKAFEHIYNEIEPSEIQQLNATLQKIFANLDT